MELVIDIPEDLYKATINGLNAEEIWDLRVAIKNGTPQPKMGRWTDVNGDGSLFKCDKCNETVCCSGNKYCPNCGAKMQEVEE